jgi:hypothetical protein
MWFKKRIRITTDESLNKDNIETLGFIYNEDSKRYEMDKSNPMNYRFYYLYHRPGDLIYKSIITIYLNGTSQSDVIVYRIWITTMTELKVLLKQLSINE